MTKDLTIIYYTANKISDHFLSRTKEVLLKAAGDFPIISVSQKPMELGKNICVGDIGQSYINIYRQALTGAKAAKTEYIALVEDDALYSSEHFTAHRPPQDVFSYNMSCWSIYTWVKPPMYSYKGRRAMLNLICNRKLFIEAMEERFKKYPKPEEIVETGKWSEPGKYEDQLGVASRKSEEFYTVIPNVVFSHEEAVAFKNLGTRKKIGNLRSLEIPFWGRADEIMNIAKPETEVINAEPKIKLDFQYNPVYSSHIPILIKVMERSKGPVLELGSGVFSTPLLHWLSLDTKRHLVTYENYKEHFEMNKVFETPDHEIKFLENWDDAKIEGTHWGVAFVDHEPGERRYKEIARLANICDFVVVHDSESDHDGKYGFIEKSFPLFKYRYNYKRRRPYTTVLSNFVDITHI